MSEKGAAVVANQADLVTWNMGCKVLAVQVAHWPDTDGAWIRLCSRRRWPPFKTCLMLCGSSDYHASIMVIATIMVWWVAALPPDPMQTVWPM